MKILILCKKFPYPLKEGEPIAISYLARSLNEAGCDVSLLVLNTSKHYFDISSFPEEENFYDEIHAIETNNDINIFGALKCFIAGESYMLSRFHSKNFDKKLTELLSRKTFDVVQLETIYMAHYIDTIRRHSNAIVSIRSHNVEQLIWERVAAITTFIPKRWYLNNQNKYLKSFEVNKLNNCDLLVSITDEDLKTFTKLGFKKEGVSIPVGFNYKDYEAEFQFDGNKQTIAFIGALDWMPNQDGIVWFIKNVWPELLKEFPNLELHIAGKNTPDWLMKMATKNIFIHGEVADAKAFIADHPVLIAPLFSGSGIKIKVLEGLVMGRVVVTTKIGVEGIPARHEKDLFICNNKEEFQLSIRKILSKKIESEKIRKSGIELIKKEFDPKKLASKLLFNYQNLVGKKKIN